MTAVLRRGGTGFLVSVVVVAAFAIPAGSAVRSTAKPTGKKAAAVLLMCAKKKTGQLRLVRRARACRKAERLVRWSNRGASGVRGRAGVDGRDGAAGAAGVAGTQGSVGPQGPAGPPGADSVALLSARLTGYSGVLSPAFGSPQGTTAVSANEDLVETLAPARDLSASNLAVQTTSAPGAGESVTVTLRDDGVDTALSCTIAGSATSCTNVANSAAIAAGSTLSVEVSSTAGVLSLSVLAGFETR